MTTVMKIYQGFLPGGRLVIISTLLIERPSCRELTRPRHREELLESVAVTCTCGWGQGGMDRCMWAGVLQEVGE